MIKRIYLFLAASLICNSCALASGEAIPQSDYHSSGPYLGVQLGGVKMDYDASYLIKPPYNANATVKNDKFVGSAYIGYAFDEFLALQLGYTYFDKPEFIYDGVQKDLTQYGIDLSIIGSLAFKHNLGGYLKAGLILIERDEVSGDQYFIARDSNSKLTELFGLGATYSINTHFAFDLAWSHIFSNGDLPKADLYTLGIKYKF